MKARPATIDDLPQLLEMGRKFHAMGPHKGPYVEADVSDMIAGLLRGGGVFIHDHGMIGGMMVPAYCGKSWVMAVELFWWADRHGLALLLAFEEWARDNGASEIRMTTLADHPKADAILRKRGYTPCEISYTKVT